MPADRFPFAVRVSGKDQAAGFLCCISNRFHLIAVAFVRIDLPVHVEILVRAHAAILGRQVANVTVGSEDFEVSAQIFLDSFRLGRRLNNDQLHGGRIVPLRVYVYVRASLCGLRGSSRGMFAQDTIRRKLPLFRLPRHARYSKLRCRKRGKEHYSTCLQLQQQRRLRTFRLLTRVKSRALQK